MDGAVDDLTNSGNLGTERHISQHITYMCNLKNSANEFIYKTEADSQT